MIETAITTGSPDGCTAKNNIIRTQGPINQLHEVVKSSLIQYGVNPNNVRPSLGQHQGEQKLTGFIKTKDQDICALPNNVKPTPQVLTYNGLLRGVREPLGDAYTERVLAINVRSQLSSVAKNFDTLYERTFAEALNLHLRCPNIVLGEFYMIPVYEYDDSAARSNQVRFKPNNNIKSHIRKYLASFGAVNGRNNSNDPDFKYERACLLIVDFSQRIPKIYNTDQELIADGLLDPTTGFSINNLSYTNFINDLMDIYNQRFGAGRFI